MNSAQAEAEWRYYLNNPPQKASSYYNQSFVDRINAAQNNLNNLVAEKDKAYSTQQQAYNDYDTFTGNMRSYNEYYQEAENQFGVTQAKDDYESTQKALAMTESMLEALPSSISARSGRRLTQEQRNLQYNRQADIINATQGELSRAANTYEQAWKTARENQAAKATAGMVAQQTEQQDLANKWNTQLQEYYNKLNSYNKSQYELAAERAAYSQWQLQQRLQASAIWEQQLQAAGERYRQILATEQAQRQANAQLERQKREYEAEQARLKAKDRLAQSLVNLHWAQQGGVRAW